MVLNGINQQLKLAFVKSLLIFFVLPMLSSTVNNPFQHILLNLWFEYKI
jgi:hypothetical protein